MTRRVSSRLSMMLVVGTYALLCWLEQVRPLRRMIAPRLQRQGRNLAMACATGLALQMTERPATTRLTHIVEQRRWGLLKRIHLPHRLELSMGLLLLDYTLYLWHVLTHRLPAFWRFHVVHHVDVDLDVSTAVRFHVGEMVISVLWRCGQIVLLGIAPRTLSIWQVATLLSVMFHHSNLRLPIHMERWLNRVIVTPRMHGIHHSIIRDETDSNWSSGLTLWDHLHGTYRGDVPQGAVTIGVPAYRDSGSLVLPALVSMPFRHQRPTWRLSDGRECATRGQS
jgi:sterol desaturase/sphingolipid hydroxylase (fatty acid hydroxylase superfamily)